MSVACTYPNIKYGAQSSFRTPNNRKETSGTRFRRQYLEEFAAGCKDQSNAGQSDGGSCGEESSWQSCNSQDVTSHRMSRIDNTMASSLGGGSVHMSGCRPLNRTGESGRSSSRGSDSEWSTTLGSSAEVCRMSESMESPRGRYSQPLARSTQGSRNLIARNLFNAPVCTPTRPLNQSRTVAAADGGMVVSHGNESALDEISDDFIRRPTHPGQQQRPRYAKMVISPGHESVLDQLSEDFRRAAHPKLQRQAAVGDMVISHGNESVLDQLSEDFRRAPHPKLQRQAAVSEMQSAGQGNDSESFQMFFDGAKFVQSSWQGTPDRNPATPRGFDLRVGANERRSFYINDEQIESLRQALSIPRVQPVSPMVIQVGQSIIINGKMGVGADGGQQCQLGGACAGGQLLDGSVPQMQFSPQNTPRSLPRRTNSVLRTPNNPYTSDIVDGSHAPVGASTPFAPCVSPNQSAIINRRAMRVPQAPLRPQRQAIPRDPQATPTMGQHRRSVAVDQGRQLNYSANDEDGSFAMNRPAAGANACSPCSPPRSCQVVGPPNAPIRPQYGHASSALGNVRRLNYSASDEYEEARLEAQEESEAVAEAEATLWEDAVLDASLVNNDADYVVSRSAVGGECFVAEPAEYITGSLATTEPGTGRPMVMVGARTMGYYPDEAPKANTSCSNVGQQRQADLTPVAWDELELAEVLMDPNNN